MRPQSSAIPPPSIGHALMFHAPLPSFAGLESAAPSLEMAMYISRVPPTQFRKIAQMRPGASIAAERWQHWQMEPSGDS
jgi:hypothetical protein